MNVLGQLRPSQISCLEYVDVATASVAVHSPSTKASMKELWASSCCYRGSEYVASPHCWSHWWTERKHSRHLHYNFSHSSLSCHCHWKSHLCPRSTWSCSHRHMIEVEWDFNDWYMWFKFQFTNDAKFRFIAGECICGKTYAYRHTYRLTQLMYYMSMWGLLRSAPITQCWHAQSVVKQLLLSIWVLVSLSPQNYVLSS